MIEVRACAESSLITVSTPEKLPTLPVGVRDYEPHLALDGGIGGYTVFDRLIQAAPHYLKVGGYLIVEIGSPQEGPARQRMETQGGYELGPTIKDGKGSAKFWVKDGVLSKYEYKVTGSMNFNGNDIDVDRTTTVEIKEVGTTKIEVPEGAKKKLS